MKRLEEQGMRQLILDLRGNPGGLLDQAIDVASEFLPRGQVVVSVKGRTEYSEPIVYKSTGSDPATDSSRDSDQSQQCFGFGDRCRRDSGSRPRTDRRRNEFRQRTGAAHIPVAFQHRTHANNSALLHSLRTFFATRLFERLALRLLHASRSRREISRATPNTSRNLESPLALASPTPHPHTGPAVQTAVGRVFYGGGGITPDIEVKEPVKHACACANRRSCVSLYATTGGGSRSGFRILSS